MRLRKIKSTSYTTIDNNIFHNYALSFKAKGLLCQMLSLPDNWEFSIKGLASLGKEKQDAVRTALTELEEAGYLKRSRERDNGQYAGAEYIVSETPMTDDEATEEKSEKPMSEKPIWENPIWENPTHINNIPNKELKESNTKGICVRGAAEKPTHTKEKPPAKKIPPTLDMVKDYCKERENSVDAEKFFDFYESKGWLVGKNKMKDWQAAVRTWERKDNNDGMGANAKYGEGTPTFTRTEKDYDEW